MQGLQDEIAIGWRELNQEQQDALLSQLELVRDTIDRWKLKNSSDAFHHALLTLLRLVMFVASQLRPVVPSPLLRTIDSPTPVQLPAG